MQTVICKKCSSEIILTSDDEKELKKWKDKDEICFRCKQRNTYNKSHEQKLMPKQDAGETKEIDVRQLEMLYNHFDELRTKYFEAKEKFFTALHNLGDFNFFEYLYLGEGQHIEFDMSTYLEYGDNLGRKKSLSWKEFIDMLPNTVKSILTKGSE